MSSLTASGRSACFSCRVKVKVLARGARTYSSAAVHNQPSLKRRLDRFARTRLPEKPARTRFAPSPTGYLHLGSLRTALYNYLLARATKGQFILRLEDTDQSRIVPDAEARLYEDLRWSGLSWDEGPDRGGPCGPYKQSQRLDIYNDYINILLEDKKAFRCFCSHEDLASHHHKSLETDGMFGTYPGMCLSISSDESNERASKGEAHTVRFRSSLFPTAVQDIVYGSYKKKLAEDHFIIMKSDGFPTYHFANVVDDHLMGITHVVRGAEWLISTAKHVSLYDAFGWEPPKFAHVGLLVDSNRQKLSKRNMDIGIDSYRRDRIPPPALLNFSALLGWNPGASSNKGVMDLDDMVTNFEMRFTKGDIIVNPEKLAFFHKKHIQKALNDASPDSNDLIDEYVGGPVLRKVREIEADRKRLFVDELGHDYMDVDLLSSLGEPIINLTPATSNRDGNDANERIRSALRISRSEATDPAAMVKANRYLIWQPPVAQLKRSFVSFLPQLTETLVNGQPGSVVEALDYLSSRLGQIDDSHWSVSHLQVALDEVTKSITCSEPGRPPTPAGYKFLRWALLGLDNGPQMSNLMEYLGRTETLSRLQTAGTVVKSESVPGVERGRHQNRRPGYPCGSVVAD